MILRMSLSNSLIVILLFTNHNEWGLHYLDITHVNSQVVFPPVIPSSRMNPVNDYWSRPLPSKSVLLMTLLSYWHIAVSSLTLVNKPAINSNSVPVPSISTVTIRTGFFPLSLPTTHAGLLRYEKGWNFHLAGQNVVIILTPYRPEYCSKAFNGNHDPVRNEWDNGFSQSGIFVQSPEDVQSMHSYWLVLRLGWRRPGGDRVMRVPCKNWPTNPLQD